MEKNSTKRQDYITTVQDIMTVKSMWYGVDGMAEKYPGWSPYNYTLLNPIILSDPDRNEPARNQAGTIQDAITQWKALKYTSINQVMNLTGKNKSIIINGQAQNVIRYVYTEKGGWIDLQHYFGVQEYGELPMDALEGISGMPIMQDTYLGGGANDSYCSYEDLPTNEFSSQIDLEGLEGDELFDAVLKHFEGAGAMNPEEAPNWNQIPNDDKDRTRIPEIKSTKRFYNRQQGHYQNINTYYARKEKQELLKSGKYIPQNRSSKPYDLTNFPAANTSLIKQ